jgi:hypothetical protein
LRCAPRDGATWVDDAVVGFARRPLDGLGEFARHLPSAVAGAIASMTHEFAPAVVRRSSRG